MNKLVLITSSSLRHLYFIKKINDVFGEKVINFFVETTSDLNYDHIYHKNNIDVKEIHFNQRHNSEIDFFSDSSIIMNNMKLKLIKKGEINKTEIVSEIKNIRPDIILTYGCSIIKKPLLNFFKNKIINVHLGLSPYYLGAGTNFHALVNNEFYFFGYSIIFMDEGIDTGKIIHQSRPIFFLNDTPHTLGNRLIKKMVADMVKIVKNFNQIEDFKATNTNLNSKIFKISDCDDSKIKKLYREFNNNLISYILNKKKLTKKYPIIEQKFMKE